MWLSSETHDGTAIAQHLGVRRFLVAHGERWGDERHVRVTLRDADATDRLIAALRIHAWFAGEEIGGYPTEWSIHHRTDIGKEVQTAHHVV